MKNTTIPSKNNKRKATVVVLAGLAVTGLVGASAASLGGINDESLGADAASVLSCDTVGGVDVEYNTSFDEDTDVYEVDTVTVSSVDVACGGLAYKVTLTDGTTELGEATGTVPVLGGSFDADFVETAPADGVDAEAVEGIAIVISG